MHIQCDPGRLLDLYLTRVGLPWGDVVKKRRANCLTQKLRDILHNFFSKRRR